MLQEIDFNGIAKRINKLRKLARPGDVSRVCACIESIRDLPFTPGFLDSVREDLLAALGAAANGQTTYVYLAFYGSDDRADYLKIGITRNVKSRIIGIRTGNPLPNLWTFSARLRSREEAAIIEAALLQHMSLDRVSGEWVRVHGIGRSAAIAIAESLAEVATDVQSETVDFQPYGFLS